MTTIRLDTKPCIIKTLYASTEHIPRSVDKLLWVGVGSNWELTGFEIQPGPRGVGWEISKDTMSPPGIQDIIDMAEALQCMRIRPLLNWAFRELRVDALWLSPSAPRYPQMEVFPWN